MNKTGIHKTNIHKTSIHKTNIYKKKTLGISLFLALILLCASLAGCGGAVGQQNVSAAETGEESVSAGGAGTSLTASAQSAIEGSTEAASAYATESAAMESTEAAPAYATESAAMESTEAASTYTTESAAMESTEAASSYATESAASESTEAAPAYATESAADPLQAIDVEDLIKKHVGTMSIEDKVSGLFIITPEALTGVSPVTEAGETTKEAIESLPVAGLIYFAGNIESREQLVRMLANTEQWGGVNLGVETTDKNTVRQDPSGEPESAAAGESMAAEAAAEAYAEDAGGTDQEETSGYTIHIPPFLAVDEEGGLVSRIADSSIEVPYVGSMADIGASGDPEAAFEAGNTIGGYLHELGFNLDFAPDADVLIDPGNQTIGDRSFGTDPALCGQMVGRYVDGLHQNGIASCIKHFPGLGDTETDTHTGGAWSSRTLEDYQGAEFLSFLGGINAGTDMIMISHLSNTELTGSDLPASLNKTLITDILRSGLGYEGVIITDSFQMGAVTERFDSAEAAVTAIEAGADLVLMPMDFRSARQGILDAVAAGRISEERIDQSLCRILLTRYKTGREEKNN